MSKFTDEMYATAQTSTRGLVTGEPDAPLRQTWGEIHRQARRMAGGLAEAGIGHGDAVGVLAGLPVDIAPACQATWMRGASLTMLHQPTPRTDLAVWAARHRDGARMIDAQRGGPRRPVRRAAPLLRGARHQGASRSSDCATDPTPTGADRGDPISRCSS